MTSKQPESTGSELKRELLLLAKLAGPLVVSSASDYFGKLLTTIFAGHILTTSEFDAVALGNTMTNITGYSMIIAFASPMDSLCTQANGAQNWKLYSVTVHRALICTALFLIPTVLLWLNMEQVLILCGQNPDIALNVYRWTLIYLAMLPAYTIRTILIRFLSSQAISQPLLYIGIFVYILWHPSWLCLIFVVLGQSDFLWFPICNVVTTYLQITLILGYIVLYKPHHPLTLQRVSLSKIFRWRTDGNFDKEGNVKEGLLINGNGVNSHDSPAVRASSAPPGPVLTSTPEPVVKGSGAQLSNVAVIDKGISEYIQLLIAGKVIVSDSKLLSVFDVSDID